MPALPDALPGAFDVWTDGACSGNPGPMGIGVVVLHDGQRKELGEYLGVGTNNIAELTAIERGLEMVAEMAKAEASGSAKEISPRMRRVRVYSDSGYAIGLLEQGWKAKANQELVARSAQARRRRSQPRVRQGPRATPASPRTSAATSWRARRSTAPAAEASLTLWRAGQRRIEVVSSCSPVGAVEPGSGSAVTKTSNWR